jgi:hypothetical protein
VCSAVIIRRELPDAGIRILSVFEFPKAVFWRILHAIHSIFHFPAVPNTV